MTELDEVPSGKIFLINSNQPALPFFFFHRPFSNLNNTRVTIGTGAWELLHPGFLILTRPFRKKKIKSDTLANVVTN